MALAPQGCLVMQAGNSAIVDAFCAGRLEGRSGNTLGMLPHGIELQNLIDRCRVA
ncbi:MAG: hypothetical protein OIF38_18355 [Cellvibrionaceae bacterium]|nr:hypothetical protein [Cellvibrionaceae bacterium]